MRRIDRRRVARRMLAPCVLACLLSAHAARAQTADRGIEFEDLGFTRPPEISARAAGLSGSVATVNDATALALNPAGLCRIKQRTPMLGLAHGSTETVTSYPGSSQGLSSSWSGLQFVGAAASIPVIQGALVPAVAVYRAFVSNLDIAYQARNQADARDDAYRLQQDGSTYAFAAGFGIDLASVLSAGMSVSALQGGYHALRQSHTRTDDPGGAIDRYVVDDTHGDLSGVVAHVGVILFANRHAHLAVDVSTPTLVNGSTNTSRETTEQVENGTGTTTRVQTTASAEYLIPYRIDGGIAMPWGDWLVSVQVGSCDWSQSAIDGRHLSVQSGDAVLGRTLDYRAGVEWTTPWWPLRLRAGAARLPFAPNYLEADRIDNDRLERVTAETQPLRFSIGAGIALRNSVLIDAAFTHTHGDRSVPSFSETRNGSQVLIEGSYWF